MKLITIFWRDIPAQIIAKKGRVKAKKQLSRRFQEAIDRAAMRAGKGSSEAYMNEWRRETVDLASADMEALVADRADELEAGYNAADIEALIRNKGFADTGQAERSPTEQP